MKKEQNPTLSCVVSYELLYIYECDMKRRCDYILKLVMCKGKLQDFNTSVYDYSTYVFTVQTCHFPSGSVRVRRKTTIEVSSQNIHLYPVCFMFKRSCLSVIIYLN